MASVTFPEALGGNGQTYTDDADPNTGLDGLGYTIRFIPCLQQAVAMGLSAKNDAQAADGFVQQCQTLRQETATDRQAVAEDRAAVEQYLQDAQARIGTTQALIDARDTALAAQAGAEDAETGAVAAQTSAEAARDAAVVSGQVYPDTSAGLTATSDGQYFKTVAANQAGFLTLWRNNAGVATEIETYPSLTGIAQALEQANRKQTRLARSLQRLGDHGQTLHSDFDLDAHGLGTALVGGVQDALDSGELWTTVRETPTLAYQHTADGALKYVEVPPNVLAREWNPEMGWYQLQSPQGATNDLQWATKFNEAVWGGNLASFSSAISIIEGEVAFSAQASGGTFSGFYQSGAAFTSAGSSGSIIVEQESAETLDLGIYDATTAVFVCRARLNFLTGVLSVVQGEGKARALKLSDNGPNGGAVYRVLITAAGAPGNSSRLWIYPAGTSASNDSSIMHHAQLVEGTNPGSVIVTRDAPVTRAPDQINRVMGSEFHRDVGTIVARFIMPTPSGDAGVGIQEVVRLDDGSDANRLMVRVDGDRVTAFFINTEGVVASNTNLGRPAIGDIVTVAVSWSPFECVFASSESVGSTVSTGYSAIEGLVFRLGSGRDSPVNFLSGQIAMCFYSPEFRRLSYLEEVVQ